MTILADLVTKFTAFLRTLVRRMKSKFDMRVQAFSLFLQENMWKFCVNPYKILIDCGERKLLTDQK